MKKFLTAAFAGVLIMSALTGCGNDGKENNIPVETGTAVPSSEDEQAEELSSEALNDGAAVGEEETEVVIPQEDAVQVIFPASAFSNLDEKEINKQAATMGAKAVVNGSEVVYTMTREAQQKEIELIKSDLLEDCDTLSSEKSQYPFIKEITLNDDLTEMTVKVDKAEYEEQTDISFETLANRCLSYQSFSEVALDDLKATVHIVDNSNGSEFKTETYNKDGLVS